MLPHAGVYLIFMKPIPFVFIHYLIDTVCLDIVCYNILLFLLKWALIHNIDKPLL